MPIIVRLLQTIKYPNETFFDYVLKSCSTYLHTNFGTDFTQMATSCRKIHPRGANVIFISTGQLGRTFTPSQCSIHAPMCFMDFDNGIKDIIKLVDLGDSLEIIGLTVESYDPETEILFLFIIDYNDKVMPMILRKSFP
jgi:hypothetical protein